MEEGNKNKKTPSIIHNATHTNEELNSVLNPTTYNSSTVLNHCIRLYMITSLVLFALYIFIEVLVLFVL